MLLLLPACCICIHPLHPSDSSRHFAQTPNRRYTLMPQAFAPEIPAEEQATVATFIANTVAFQAHKTIKKCVREYINNPNDLPPYLCILAAMHSEYATLQPHPHAPITEPFLTQVHNNAPTGAAFHMVVLDNWITAHNPMTDDNIHLVVVGEFTNKHELRYGEHTDVCDTYADFLYASDVISMDLSEGFKAYMRHISADNWHLAKWCGVSEACPPRDEEACPPCGCSW